VSTLGIVLLVVLAVLVLLFVGGYVANARRRRADAARLHALTQEADRRLADAHADDKGWERAGLEAAAREAYAARRGGVAPRQLRLVQVVDRPGTEDDEAIFEADGGDRLVLGRHDGRWVPR
jgi:hypothetical protein